MTTYASEEERVTEHLGGLTTEAARSDLTDLDTRATLALVELVNDEDATVPGAVRRAAPQIAVAVDAIATRLAAGGRLLYVGAGTGGRIAVLDAVECEPTYNTPPGQVVAVLAGGVAAGANAREGDEDDAGAGVADLAALDVTAHDAVVGISASGRTPYVVGALAHARDRGALTVGLVCNAEALLSGAVDVAVEVVVGPEIVAGSTRMKAGTAQKLVLNTISTLVMVRLGHTYGNLMVDVRIDNEKLRQRAARVVAQATGLTEDAATAALAEAGGEAKVAVVATLAGVSQDEARRRLLRADGHVRQALE